MNKEEPLTAVRKLPWPQHNLFFLPLPPWLTPWKTLLNDKMEENGKSAHLFLVFVVSFFFFFFWSWHTVRKSLVPWAGIQPRLCGGSTSPNHWITRAVQENPFIKFFFWPKQRTPGYLNMRRWTVQSLLVVNSPGQRQDYRSGISTHSCGAQPCAFFAFPMLPFMRHKSQAHKHLLHYIWGRHFQ